MKGCQWKRWGDYIPVSQRTHWNNRVKFMMTRQGRSTNAHSCKRKAINSNISLVRLLDESFLFAWSHDRWNDTRQKVLKTFLFRSSRRRNCNVSQGRQQLLLFQSQSYTARWMLWHDTVCISTIPKVKLSSNIALYFAHSALSQNSHYFSA